MMYSTKPISCASRTFSKFMLIGVLSFQPFRLLSIMIASSLNISGNLRFFSCSIDSLRVRVIAGAKVVVLSIMVACLP